MVRQLVEAGHDVWGIARREPLLAELDQELGSPRFRYSVCDVQDAVAVQAVHAQMLEQNFAPDVFILNAAVDIEEPVPALHPAATRDTLRTNLEGALIWVNLFIEQCVAEKRGQFIAISSLFALWPDTSSPAYAASKSGLSMAFRSLRLRYRNSGVRFQTVYLGPVDTNINPRFAAESAKKPAPWVATPESAARTIVKSIFRSRNTVYYPRYMSVLVRLFGWMPDLLFEILTRPLKR